MSAARVHARVPNNARVRHLERLENQPESKLLKRLSGDRLDYTLQIEVTLSGKAEPVSWRKMRA
jgi:hypothetical protein